MVSPHGATHDGRMSSEPSSMQTLRFHAYGEPADVLVLERAPVPSPAPGRVLVAVHAVGLNPADWALCRGLFPGQLPRGVGLDVAGVVDAVGERVIDVAVGDRVVGAADFAGVASAGASDFAILDHWARLPAELDVVAAAALPMAIETAGLHLDGMQLAARQTLVVHGAGTTVGFAAVQIARLRGARVIATAGETYAARLRALGAQVTPYGDGMVDRIRALTGGTADLVLDTSPAVAGPGIVNKLVRGDHAAPAVATTGILGDLVAVVGGDARRVVTISHMAGAAAIGVRTSFDLLRPGDATPAARSTLLRAYLGKVEVPVARTFPLAAWRDALAISLGGNARGKLVLLPRD